MKYLSFITVGIAWSLLVTDVAGEDKKSTINGLIESMNLSTSEACGSILDSLSIADALKKMGETIQYVKVDDVYMLKVKVSSGKVLSASIISSNSKEKQDTFIKAFDVIVKKGDSLELLKNQFYVSDEGASGVVLRSRKYDDSSGEYVNDDSKAFYIRDNIAVLFQSDSGICNDILKDFEMKLLP